jgi:hypothetical protein
MLAKRVEAMGAGTSLPPGLPERTPAQLSRLLRSRDMQRSAAAFATKYAGFDAAAENARMADDLESLLN